MTQEQRETLIRQIGVLEGLTWFPCTDATYNGIADALELVVSRLEEILEEDENAD